MAGGDHGRHAGGAHHAVAAAILDDDGLGGLVVRVFQDGQQGGGDGGVGLQRGRAFEVETHRLVDGDREVVVADVGQHL